MDRRTLIFVIALALSLFAVNLYFDQQRQENLKEWNEQLKSSQAQKQKLLETEISSHTAKESELPLVELFADNSGKEFLTLGTQSDQSILTESWDQNIPHTVYARKLNDTKPPEEYRLTFLPQNLGEPVLYQQKGPAPLKIGNLPDFGSYNLQLVSFSPKNSEHPVEVNLGNYVDGHLTIPAKQLEKMKNEIAGKENLPSDSKKNSIVLIKTGNEFLPVAMYYGASQQLSYLDEIQGLKTLLVAPQVKETTGSKAEEKYYVIETPYQQLVFSNYGGALAEINLPFESEKNKLSVVKEIAFDRDMVKNHPYNAHFPAHAYYTPSQDANGKPQEHLKGQLGGYYPLIRRDLIESGNRKSIHVQPRYYALNIVSEYPEVAELVYEVKHFDKNSIVFESAQSHRRITKTYTLKGQDKSAPYVLDLSIKIEGDSRGLWISTGVPEAEWISGGLAPALKYRITRNNKPDVEPIDLPKDSLTVTSIYPDWICDSNGFLGLILDPLTPVDPGYRAQMVPGTVVPSRLIEIEEDYNRFKPEDLPGYMTLLPLKSTGGTMTFRVFAGPFSDTILKQVDQIYSDPATGYNPDYVACQSFHGWFAFISEPFAKFLFILMKFFHYLTGSWGFSIILLTVALRIMMYPLNAWSSKSMLKMQQIAPETAAIQEKYKKDPKKAQIEIMNLYRERSINPASGCLPMLIQMPFLIGMFDLLKSTFELRGASFIPGWIDDLASPDVLFSWHTPIFFIGNEFHLLPIILGAVMFLQQKMMSTAPADPSQLTDQQRQQKAMGTIMSIVFAFMFYNFPSGLNIYWLSSMILGILQQWWTAKRMQSMPVTAPAKASKNKT